MVLAHLPQSSKTMNKCGLFYASYSTGAFSSASSNLTAATHRAQLSYDLVDRYEIERALVCGLLVEYLAVQSPEALVERDCPCRLLSSLV